MSNPSHCPGCGNEITQVMEYTHDDDQIREKRLCNNCATQYEVVYSDPYIVVDRDPTDGGDST